MEGPRTVDMPCGGLDWERKYRLSDKCTCEENGVCACTPEFLCPSWSCVSWATWGGKKGTTALLQEGAATSGCQSKACNPVNFTIINPGDYTWQWGARIGVRVYGCGRHPGTVLYFKRVTTTHPTTSRQVFHSFSEEISSPPPISVPARNLFLVLAETRARTLKISSCRVCGGTNLGINGHGRPGN